MTDLLKLILGVLASLSGQRYPQAREWLLAHVIWTCVFLFTPTLVSWLWKSGSRSWKNSWRAPDRASGGTAAIYASG